MRGDSPDTTQRYQPTQLRSLRHATGQSQKSKEWETDQDWVFNISEIYTFLRAFLLCCVGTSLSPSLSLCRLSWICLALVALDVPAVSAFRASLFGVKGCCRTRVKTAEMEPERSITSTSTAARSVVSNCGQGPGQVRSN